MKGTVSPIDLVVLVSGSGTNLQAVLDAIADEKLDARVRRVISNIEGAKALERAAKASVPTCVLSHKSFASRTEFDAALAQVVKESLQGSSRGWVVLAGFMRILGPTFLEAFPHRVINVHPALLPSFPGVHAQRQALEKGVRITGCTVHLVDAGTDTGPILAQTAVPVLDDDDEVSLTARILAQEHKLLPTVLQWIAEDRLHFVDGRPKFRGVIQTLSG
jgi:phosphoribosylglycinamide formyltransferase-1